MTLFTFQQFAPSIAALVGDDLSDSAFAPFRLASDGAVSIYYAPFDWINPNARVAIVGITPGRSSMVAAFRAARSALRAGSSLEDAARAAKQTGSFSNMRFKLAQLLDELELNRVLGLPGCLDLFGPRADLLHPTSCVRYPVFKDGENYTGSNPPLARFPLFRPYIVELLGAELASLPTALVVPCGVNVAEALKLLIADGRLDERRCLIGFPHASGANGHLGRIWAAERDQLRARVATWAASR